MPRIRRRSSPSTQAPSISWLPASTASSRTGSRAGPPSPRSAASSPPRPPPPLGGVSPAQPAQPLLLGAFLDFARTAKRRVVAVQLMRGDAELYATHGF